MPVQGQKKTNVQDGRKSVHLFLYKGKSNYGREHNKLFPQGGRIREGKVNLLQKEYNTLMIQITDDKL